MVKKQLMFQQKLKKHDLHNENKFWIIYFFNFTDTEG